MIAKRPILRLIFLLCVIFFTKHCVAKDTIIVRKDNRVDRLVTIQKEYNLWKTTSAQNKIFVKGYKLQVASTPNREEAYQIKAQLHTLYPTEKVDVIFQSPSYKVRFGNFINKEDALQWHSILNPTFDNNVYVIEDQLAIDPPPFTE